MRYEGVTFVTEACKGMSKEEFIERHKDVFWQDRDEKTREKMLADVWKRMNPVPEAPKNEKK